jgi:hypothetical protein
VAGGQTAAALSSALRVNRSLSVLLLSENGFGAGGATMLSEALKVRPPRREWR